MAKDAPKGRQIWLTAQDAELSRDACDFWMARLNEGTVLSEAHKTAGRYVYRRLQVLRSRFQMIVDQTTNTAVSPLAARAAIARAEGQS